VLKADVTHFSICQKNGATDGSDRLTGDRQQKMRIYLIYNPDADLLFFSKINHPMTIILSEKDLPASAQIASQPTSQPTSTNLGFSQTGSFDLLIQAPDANNRSYKRSLNLRHGLNLLIRDYWLDDGLIEENLPEIPGLTLEFGFDLLDCDLTHHGNTDISNGFLMLSENRTHAEFQEWQGKGRVVKIDLHLRTQQGAQSFSQEQLELIPAELREVVELHQDKWDAPLGVLAPNIQFVLQQILNCPYSGSIQQVYLEGKALELIALQSARFLQSERSQPHPILKRSDIERIYQARELVTQQLDHPPSLLDLAHAVGLNDCTLKRGFRQVFSTTVFGYIRQQRLIKARQLLQDTEMSVTEVTCLVGYTHPGHFAAAFKREFGVSPKVFKHSAQ
jgi:AraC-like DNA-binding protein